MFARGILAVVLSTVIGAPSMLSAETYRVYIGTYTGKDSQGISQALFDTETGKFSELKLAGTAVNPSFLAIHPSRKFLYSVGEVSDFQGKKAGGVNAFAIDSSSGQLTLLNQQSSEGEGPCHLVVDKAGGTVLVANYGGGSICSLPIASDGTLQPAASAIKHQPPANSTRKITPRGHSINLDTANRYAIVADLGLDQVLVYKFDPQSHTLTPNDPAGPQTAVGAGPRHFAFHPSGKFGYVINETNNTVNAYAYDADRGVLTEIQSISTLPEGYTGKSYTAEVVVHPTGKFLYGSNRGHDSIAVFQIDAGTGKLTAKGQTPTGGKTPRNFVIDPTGAWLLAENQATGTIKVFRIDPSEGTLTATDSQLEIASPVCVKFLPLK